MPVMINKKGSSAVIKSTATETITLANLQATNETVTEAIITRISWSGTVAIARGANTHVNLSGNGEWLLDGRPIINDSTANIGITITGTGTCILEVHKKSSYPNAPTFGPVT